MPSISPEQQQQIRQISQSAGVIEGIKEYRRLTNASLKDAKDAVEAIMRGESLGTSTPQPASQMDTSSRQSQVLDLMAQGKEIEAIKLYRTWTNAGLKEAKDTVEAMARGEPVNIPPAQAGMSTDDQILDLLAKKQKIEAIKVYRLATNLGLKEAKDYVESIEAQMSGRPPVSTSAPIPLSNDPFAEENKRNRRILFFLFVVAVLVVVFLLVFRNGL